MRSLVGVFGLLLLLLVPACAREEETPLRVGTLLWPGGEPLFLARQLGFFGDGSVRLVEVRGLAEPRGKRVAVEDLAVSTYLLSRALERVGPRPSDIGIIRVPVDQHLEAHQSGQVDAVVQRFMLESGLLREPVRPEEMRDARILEALQEVQR